MSGPNSKRPVTIGDMRDHVWLQAITEQSRDDEGGVVPVWNSIAYVWASIDPMSGREMEIAAQMDSETDTRITIRWATQYGYLSTTVLPAHRFVTNTGEIYQIESAIDKGTTHRFLTCYCKLTTGRATQVIGVTDSNQALTLGPLEISR